MPLRTQLTSSRTGSRKNFQHVSSIKQSGPPRSPDLNSCNLYLWGYLKSKVYNPMPKTLKDLKANIQREVKNISTTTLNSVFLDFQKRCHLLIDANGGHIELK